MTMKGYLFICAICVSLAKLTLVMGQKGPGPAPGPAPPSPPKVGTFATTGGTANGADCIFPFYYQDCCPHYECIDTDNGGIDWCWTVNGKWGNCNADDPPSQTPVGPYPVITTETGCGDDSGALCQFPFTYNGCTYYDCTTADSGRAWCITVTNPTAGTWGCCPEA